MYFSAFLFRKKESKDQIIIACEEEIGFCMKEARNDKQLLENFVNIEVKLTNGGSFRGIRD